MSRAVAFWLAAAAASSFGGCALGPERTAPEAAAPQAFQSAVEGPGGDADLPASPASEPDQAHSEDAWWQGFDDSGLDEVIGGALANNLDIEVALANLAQARAQAGAARSDLFPSLDGFIDAGLATALNDAGAETDTVAAGLASAFTVDVFGRNRALSAAAAARLEAAGLSYEDVRRLTASATAAQYVELRRAEARLRLLDTTLDLQSRTLEIVQSRFDAGLAARLDVDRAASDLARTRAQRGLLEAAAKEAAFRLSILTGLPPDANTARGSDDSVIPILTRSPDPGSPAALIERRPDLRAAEARLVAELALIGAEKADLYPSLRLPGQIRFDASNAAQGVEAASARLSALIDIPLLDAGRRRAEVKAQEARAQAAVAQWRSATLEAFGEVETALTRIGALEERRTELQNAVQSGRSAYEQLDALYREGLASFIDVLDAQRTLISSEEALVESTADLAQAQIDLFAALGAQLPPHNKGAAKT